MVTDLLNTSRHSDVTDGNRLAIHDGESSGRSATPDDHSWLYHSLMGSCLHCTQSLQCQVSDTTDHHKILLVKHVVAFKKVDDSIVSEEHTWLAGVVG